MANMKINEADADADAKADRKLTRSERLDAFGRRHPRLMFAFVMLAALGVTLLLLSTGAAVIQYEAF